ncbi:cytochrome b5-related protein-like isoform X1 [Eriocheir sinensis]|uniref:cytochrome b5-related protein-like isoform X1 n=1 Tax=Eriocheir sinensis TaxID=95602 RepID=UPI0021CA60FC|nr:cytochrome b5-related protein-like isoform X1 [Eriocheir sinensis]XP_050723933.1 cytochrome b5-related protein-like isoform X1 [Eriocheir sinensis]
MAPREGDAQSGDSSIKLTAYKKFPTNYPHKTFQEWLSAKRIDDDVGPYWRVHDKLYDLTDFIDKHPGGKMWLQVTKGTDITEAFEASHFGEGPEKLLQKYYIKDTKTPRNSPYTFHENGFYKTLKRRVRPILKNLGRGPSWKTVLIQDGLALSYVLLTLASTALSSYTLAAFAGTALAFMVVCAHNFFHQRDNWRMYYYDLSLHSSYEWRVTHALSHHLHTNTANDIEISALEPFWELLPKSDKKFVQRYAGFIYEQALIAVIYFMELSKRMYNGFTGVTPLRPENFLIFLELLVMAAISSSFWVALKLFLTIHVTFSIVFLNIGLTVAHHHPDIFHDGDRMRDDPDWGLCQLDAVRDRYEVAGNLFLVLISFGDHTLHHLLPTVDHSKLNSLYPAFLETCKEFDIPFTFMKWSTLAVGKYMQMARITTNNNYPGFKKKAS